MRISLDTAFVKQVSQVRTFESELRRAKFKDGIPLRQSSGRGAENSPRLADPIFAS